jgi:formylglycine-generating enzyme required for sulfatase activity
VSLSSRSAQPLSANEECALKPKDVLKECDKCPEMVVVRGGSFMMGSPESEKERAKDEGPQHHVTFAKPFAVGRFSVTFDEWDACADDNGCNNYKPSDRGEGRGRQKVINVSWDDAKSYVTWLSRKTGKTYRLLSESEREYAASAGRGWSTSTNEAIEELHQANPWGLYEVHGNGWEWVEDCYQSSYDGAPSDGSAWTSGDCKFRVLRGSVQPFGNFGNLRRMARRAREAAVNRDNITGFRVARTLTP